jgi:hypothetical protein
MSRSTKSARRRRLADATDIGLNLAVIWGTCSAPPEVRTLESGSRVASLAVRTPASATTTRRGRAASAVGHRHVGADHRVGPARVGRDPRRR